MQQTADFGENIREKSARTEMNHFDAQCFSLIFWSPSPQSSVKIVFSLGELPKNHIFGLRGGFAQKRPFDNFWPGKRKRFFSWRLLCGPQIRVSVFGRTHETTGNVVCFRSGPNSEFYHFCKIVSCPCSTLGVEGTCLNPLFFECLLPMLVTGILATEASV